LLLDEHGLVRHDEACKRYIHSLDHAEWTDRAEANVAYRAPGPAVDSLENYFTQCYSFAMRRVFKVREFDRWMRKTSLTDEALCAAVAEMYAGLVDADLGGVVKKRKA
jgi:hypothetical protein